MSYTTVRWTQFARVAMGTILAMGSLAFLFASLAHAQPNTFLKFDTELTSLNLLGGPVGLPLASDPGNALGDSIQGYGFVNSEVKVTLSSQRLVSPGMASLGEACAFPGGVAAASPSGASGGCGGSPPPLNPAQLDGQQFFVGSFFDVFFDISLTDVDTRPGRDYAGQLPGSTILLPDNGPASMQSNYNVIFDKDAPNFGLIPPPEVAPYIGHFNIEIPLGGDINGNGIPDKLKFTLATHAAGDANRTFITLPNGTVIDSFDSVADLSGAIVDITSDPPFTIHLTGPTTAESLLLNPLSPEPSSGLLAIVAGLLVTSLGRKKNRR